MALKKVYAVIAIAIIAVATAGFYFFVLPSPYRVAQGEATIGKAGGCVYDGSANVTIPEGALDADTKITVKALNEGTLPVPPPPFTGLLGAATFGPDGQAFKKNVTITIPLNASKPAGSHLPLFIYNASAGVFVETDVMATVNRGGRTASVNTTHFSTGGLFDGLTEAGLDAEFTSSLKAGADGAEALMHVEAWVQTELGVTICRKVAYEWIGKCYHVSGMVFSLDYEVMGGPPPTTLDVPFGDVTAWDEWEEYEVQGLFATVHDGVEEQVSYILDLRIYLKYCTPEVVVWASDYQLKVGESATVWAEVRCDEHVLRLREINIYLSGPGTLDKVGLYSTGISGRHVNAYHATENGLATITVQYYDPDTEKTVSGSATICVGENSKVHIDQTVPWGPIEGVIGDPPCYWAVWGTFRLILDASSECGLYGSWTGTSSLYMVTEGEGCAGTTHRETWIWEGFPVSFSLPEGGGSFAIVPTEGILEGYFSGNTIIVTFVAPEALGIPGTFTFEGEIVPLEDP